LTACIKKNLHIILIIFLSLSTSQGQINLHLQMQKPILVSEFSKQLNSWNWSGRFRWRNSVDSLWHWQFAQTYRSNLLSPAAGANKWKDETNLNACFYYGKPSLLSGIYTRNWIQSDKQIASDNQFASHVMGLFTRWQKDEISLSPYSGYQHSKNRNKVEWGWDVGLRGRIIRLQLGNYTNDIMAQTDYDIYKNLRNYESIVNKYFDIREIKVK